MKLEEFYTECEKFPEIEGNSEIGREMHHCLRVDGRTRLQELAALGSQSHSVVVGLNHVTKENFKRETRIHSLQ